MERDVSVASGAQVVAALRQRGHQVAAVDAKLGILAAADEERIFSRGIDSLPPGSAGDSDLPQVVDQLVEFNPDVVFLALHGSTGEDGALQSLLDLRGLKYTGSGRLGSALAWDKDVAKTLFRHAGVPTPDWCLAPATASDVEQQIGYPVIVKPSGQGSTVGLTLVKTAGELDAAIELAMKFDSTVLIERYIPGRELTVGVLEGEALTVGEIIPKQGDIFDYEAKYQPDAAAEIFPADVPESVAAQVRELGLLAHSALRLSHYSRADFRLDAEGGLWCLEVNTLPGLSPGSLLPQSARAAGIAFDDLCERICQTALD